jgi:protoporphyrin/coproporphyrin ferrochelatase
VILLRIALAFRTVPREGVERLAVLTLGFAADCLETLEEIGVGRR